MAETIVVVGSSNTDMVLKTARFPKPGETILGGDFFMFQGGKGANQAVAAARLGGLVTLISKLGNDLFGNNAIEHYAKEGIDVSRIVQTAEAPSGVALITVNGEGENVIVVASGANALLSVADLADDALAPASFLLTQLETPIACLEYLSAYAGRHSKKLVVNPAPAAQLSDAVYKNLFLITPNETETALLTGITVHDEASAAEAAAVFKNRGVLHVVITLGAKGAYVSAEGYTGLVEAPRVHAVDSTAAGDVFNGALVVALSEGMDWKEAVFFACKAAAVSVTQMGAQSSAPYRAHINQFLTPQS